MDETMDYAYHHQEQGQGQAQLPYSQQRSRCPYFNRNEHHQQLPNIPQQQQQQQQHRSTMHYDPVHASANYWHPQGQLPPYHWQPHMLGHRPQLVPQHRSSNSASEPHFYNHGPASSFSNGLGGYSGAPPNELGGPPTMHPSFSHTQLPPPVRYGHSTPLAPSQPTTSQPLFTPERTFGQNTTSRNGAFNAASHSLNASTPPLPQDSSEPSPETPQATQSTTPESTATSTQAPPSSTSIQFGSAPPSSTPQHYPTFPLSPYRSHRSAPIGSSSSTSTSNFVPPNLRRAPGNPRRTMSRRQSPPSDGDMDSERELRMVEQVIHASGSAGRLVDGDHHMDPVRAAQFLRGSVTTKYVASSSAIQSLQSVPISDLPESERTCVICYNEFGVETPEGVKEAPLRLPKCKHVFGDHCIKKWLEDSDSCPYCRDKVPNEPRITSTNPNVNNMLRARGQVTLGGYAGFMRERDANLSQDDSTRLSAAGSSHGERRSPPTDSGEGRRRIRPRHGTLRGPGSPPFSGGSRPGSFGASTSTNHENNRRSHGSAAANRAFLSNTNTPTRPGHSSSAQVSFPGGNTSHYQVPSFGSMETSSSATPTMPLYLQQGMQHGNSHGGHGTSFPNPLNRSSLPAPLPGAWVSGLPPASDDLHRRMTPGDSNAQLQASSQWGQQ
ncbi:c3h4 type zinc finger protein [Colletotrichum incanum]|uniref:C3h4 type zinc finger protein n=1 Tax=Colletotrichum incanum TaxID=1573173 RepID=A0A161X2C1_COLIC|nr:c3h4 type zinc finger protein [Colletotrichum incanum]